MSDENQGAFFNSEVEHTETKNERYDERLFTLLPHRVPMLLINKLIDVNESSASALVYIDQDASFYQEGRGVPAWIGLEHMGQTAALIAGYQLENNLVKPHLGFLLGTRRYSSDVEYFLPNNNLYVSCKEKAVVGDSLATFECAIRYEHNHQILASASLSVYRQFDDV